MMQQQPVERQNTSSKNFPSSNSLKAAGMAGISPIALQQGLTMHNATDQQPALVHPSLQGELFPKSEFLTKKKYPHEPNKPVFSEFWWT